MEKSPFKLFEPYGPDDRDIFFGRDGEISALYNLLKQTRLVLVYGASGTGKTSLIQAGLPKAFKVTDWFRISIRRGDNLPRALTGELARQLETATPEGATLELLEQLYYRRRIPLYLVFDQFEELFTLGSHEERVSFFQTLHQILETDLPCTVILSMREEYIGHLYDYEPLAPRLFQKRFRVEPMNDATSLNVIQEMCDTYGIEMERDLENEDEDHPATAREILRKVKEGKKSVSVHLPYLQIYLHYLYGEAQERYGEDRFTGEAIAAVGELGNVLRQYIDTQIQGAQRHLKRFGIPENFALRLLDEFATDEGTKQAKRPADLAAILKTGEKTVREALFYFSDTAKLLRADENDVERYEPVHDVVALQIHELRSAEEKEFKIFLRQLQLAYDLWEKEGCPDDRLLSQRDINRTELYPDRLQERREYQVHWKDYIEKSRAEIERLHNAEKERTARELRLAEEKLAAEERSRKRQAFFTRVVAVVAVVAIGAGVFAFVKQLEAREAQEKAEGSAKEATRARITSDSLADIAGYREFEAKRQKDTADQQRLLAVQALADLQKKNADVVRLNLTNARADILNLRYEDALKKIKDVAGLGTLKKEVTQSWLEIAFWYAESGDSIRATALLDSIGGFAGVKIFHSKSLRENMKKIDADHYEYLFGSKYYPEMVLVEGGTFWMGCDEKIDSNCRFNEPLHLREVSSFWIAKYETTVWQFALFCNASSKDIETFLHPLTEGSKPIVKVNWYDAVEYSNWVSGQKGLGAAYIIDKESQELNNLINFNGIKWAVILNSDAKGFRLPNEVEWEYAAKGGQQGMNKITIYSGSNELNEVGWYTANSRGQPHRVGTKKQNALGIYDMSGNASEWCWDIYKDSPEKHTIDYSVSATIGARRVLRNCSWGSDARTCRVSARFTEDPDYRGHGFRLSKSL